MPLTCGMLFLFFIIKLFSYALLLLYELISAPGCSLSTGRAVSLLTLRVIRSLHLTARPVGVSHLALQSTSK